MVASTSNPASRTRAESPWILITLAVAAAIRSVAIFDAFRLDEIWSWAWAHHPLIYVENLAALKIDSALDILTKPRHDDVHQLITLWMYLVGDLDQWFVYRLPSLLGGLAAGLWTTVHTLRDQETGGSTAVSGSSPNPARSRHGPSKQPQRTHYRPRENLDPGSLPRGEFTKLGCGLRVL